MSIKLRKNFCKTAYSIFLYIGANQDGSLVYQTQISRALSRPINTINYWITKFKEEGLINKYLELSSKGQRLFKAFWNNECFSRKLRGHNIQIIYNVIKCPNKFPDCFSGKIYQPLENKKYKGIKTTIKDVTVLFYSPKKIVCVLPDIFGNSDEEIASGIAMECIQLKRILEEEFCISIGSHQLARLINLHVAKPNSIIAESFSLSGRNYRSKKIEIDKSKGFPEIETIDPKTALYDIKIISEIEDIKKQINNLKPN